MRIAYHVGLHCTDEDQLIRSLAQNSRWMRRRGIFLAQGHRYRTAIRDVIVRLRGETASPEAEDLLLHEILGKAEADRVLLSFDHFICGPARILGEGRLYPLAAERVTWLRRLFPSATCEFFMAIRNPATFLPAAYELQADKKGFEAFLGGVDPRNLAWSEMVARIREANPDAPLTVWCNEDTPLIWPTVMREFADLGPLDRVKGEFDVLQSIMAPEGFERMLTYLEGHPPASEIQRRRVMAAFLDKFAIEEELDEEIDLPGWTPELVDELTELYEEDLYDIERIPGVTVICP